MNIKSMSNTVRSLFLSLLLLLIYGCATSNIPTNSVVIGSSPNLPVGLKEINDSYWWRCKFIINWPIDEEPNWAVDYLLAHAVVSPVLSKNSDKISYWRFHRRAARDKSGHMFSFIFYSDPETASSVFSSINNNLMLKASVENNLVQKVYTSDTKNPKHHSISATSDKNWSPEIQKYWPSYIMGVSALWLGLIIEDMQHASQTSDDIHLLLEEYRQVESNIVDKWEKEGQHAFFHHMSAIFGYQPMLIKREIIF